jgi:hypothetical protein
MSVNCLVGSEEARAEVREGQVRGSAPDRAMVSGWLRFSVTELLYGSKVLGPRQA